MNCRVQACIRLTLITLTVLCWTHGDAVLGFQDPHAVAAASDRAATGDVPGAQPANNTNTKTAPGFRLLEKTPEPATVFDKTTDKASGVTSCTLSNGVRVHYRKLDAEPGQTVLSVAFAGGEIEETAQTKGNTSFAAMSLVVPSTSTRGPRAFARFLAGKEVKIVPGSNYGPLTINVSCPTKNLEPALEALHAILMDGKIRPKVLEAKRTKSLREMTMFRKVSHFHVVGALNDLVSGGDPRRQLTTENAINAVSVASVQAWYDRLCKTAPLEVAVLGDVSFDQALPLVATYLGSLPKRPVKSTQLDKLRHVARPTGPLFRKVEFDSTIDQAMLLTGFFAGDARNTHDARALQVAALILDERTKRQLRGVDNLATTVTVKSESMWRYRDSDRFTAVARCEPQKAEDLAKAIQKVFADFASKPARPKEFAKAASQWINYYQKGAYDNYDYWVPILLFMDMDGRDPADEANALSDYKSLTPEMVQEVFKKYYKPESEYTAIAIPHLIEIVQPKKQDKPKQQGKTGKQDKPKP